MGTATPRISEGKWMVSNFDSQGARFVGAFQGASARSWLQKFIPKHWAGVQHEFLQRNQEACGPHNAPRSVVLSGPFEAAQIDAGSGSSFVSRFSSTWLSVLSWRGGGECFRGTGRAGRWFKEEKTTWSTQEMVDRKFDERLGWKCHGFASVACDRPECGGFASFQAWLRHSVGWADSWCPFCIGGVVRLRNQWRAQPWFIRAMRAWPMFHFGNATGAICFVTTFESPTKKGRLCSFALLKASLAFSAFVVTKCFFYGFGCLTCSLVHGEVFHAWPHS